MKDPVQLGNKFINTLCDILGLTSPRIRKITIVAEYNNAVKIEVEQHGTVEQCSKVAKALEGIDVEISPVVVGEDWRKVVERRRRETAFLLAPAKPSETGFFPKELKEACDKINQAGEAHPGCSCPGPAGGEHVYPCPYWRPE